jgi:uncharacterized membrane protein YkoI
MRNKTLLSLSLASLLVMASPLALAESQLPENAISMSKILDNLKGKGVIAIKEIEYDDGVYKAKIITNDGKSDKITFNPKTGELKASENLGGLSAMDIAIKVEGQGYTNIYKMELDSDKKYEVKAVNKDGKRTKLEVDAISGKILKEKTD